MIYLNIELIYIDNRIIDIIINPEVEKVEIIANIIRGIVHLPLFVKTKHSKYNKIFK